MIETPVPLLTDKELAARYKTTPGKLAKDRHFGVGPKFVKLGRKVLYPLNEVLAYEKARLRSSTSEAA